MSDVTQLLEAAAAGTDRRLPTCSPSSPTNCVSLQLREWPWPASAGHKSNSPVHFIQPRGRSVTVAIAAGFKRSGSAKVSLATFGNRCWVLSKNSLAGSQLSRYSRFVLFPFSLHPFLGGSPHVPSQLSETEFYAD